MPERLRLRPESPESGIASISLSASKSELNRFLLLSSIHPGITRIFGTSRSKDVSEMARCLRTLGISIDEGGSGFRIESSGLARMRSERDPVTLDAGSGGTTLRFLMALAAALPRKVNLLAAPGLMARPQGDLIAALRGLGASITPASGGYLIEGAKDWPEEIRIPASTSSQFASALALVLSALPGERRLKIEGQAVSSPYIRMTMMCIRDMGIQAIETSNHFVLSNHDKPTPEQRTLHVEADASSGAFWLCAGVLGVRFVLSNYPQSDRQADTQLLSILPAFGGKPLVTQRGLGVVASTPQDERLIDLCNCPDLCPVLMALGALLPGRTVIRGAAHLRHKESDRIGDLARAFAGVGIDVIEREDGLEVEGPWVPAPGLFRTFGDHRLAMAGAVLSIRRPGLEIDDGGAVDKSYPELWEDLEKAGWEIERTSL